jgi:hypothetical protein
MATSNRPGKALPRRWKPSAFKSTRSLSRIARGEYLKEILERDRGMLATFVAPSGDTDDTKDEDKKDKDDDDYVKTGGPFANGCIIDCGSQVVVFGVLSID